MWLLISDPTPSSLSNRSVNYSGVSRLTASPKVAMVVLVVSPSAQSSLLAPDWDFPQGYLPLLRLITCCSVTMIPQPKHHDLHFSLISSAR